jgi:hypothetical protein
MNSIKIGVLAEDDTDCEAIAVLARRIAAEADGIRLAIRSYPAKGSAKLRNKAELKMISMAEDGCSAAVIVHDLDRTNGALNDERALRAELSRVVVPRGLSRLICIPVEELEAWFWSDQRVIQEVGRNKGKDSVSPHLIRKPKEELIDLSRRAHNGKARYSTNQNPRLAELLNLDICAERCPAFRDLRQFVRDLLSAA